MTTKDTIKCLIVDDIPQNLVALEALLQREDIVFLKAHSGNEALELLLEHHEIALALLDVQMPEMNGFELAPLLRRSLPEIRLIAISGYGQPEDKLRSKAAGFYDHLVKPTRQDEVLSLLDVG